MACFGDESQVDASSPHFPSFGTETAEFLVRESQVTGIGGAGKDSRVHRIMADASAYGLENLMNPDSRPTTAATLITQPMKIVEGSGIPVRAIARLPDT